MTSNHRAQGVAPPRPWHGLPHFFFAPASADSLAVFRIAFGAIMVWETWRIIQNGWVEVHYSGKEFYFTYWPFDFLQPWPADGMYLHLGVMGLFACFIALGLCYRISAAGFFIMFTYLFLLDQARYLNHFYLVCLVSFIMMFLPAHRRWSLDALLRPALAAATVPVWSLWLLRFQIAVPMFFGGVAKLNADWLQGEPLRAWLADRTDFPLLGSFFTDAPVVWGFVYGGLLVDLLFLPVMINRRTRAFGLLVVLLFHFANTRLFSIGIFPWFMMAATLIFFPPDWPSRVWADIKNKNRWRLFLLLTGLAAGGLLAALLPEKFGLLPFLTGAVVVGVAFYHLPEPFQALTTAVVRDLAETPAPGLSRVQKFALAVLGVWALYQVLVPLRHLAIPGNVHWTEEGHNFSWHMKLRDKDSDAVFVVTDRNTAEEWPVDPNDHLTSWQSDKMGSRPALTLQFAHYLEELSLAEGRRGVEVRAHVTSSLNGRPAQSLVDPAFDLTQAKRPWFGHASWILPLETPLPNRD